MSADLLIRMHGIDKRFPGVQALKDAQFELRPGEVHALVGENGAGKSTLMKVLTGIYQRDAGTIEVDGQKVEVPDPRAGRDLGISMIHQELVLAPHLTVAQNIYLGREPRGRLSFTVDDKTQVRQTTELIEQLGLKLDPTAKVMELKVAQQQMVEIAKALSLDASVLIMDEPTAALTDTEIGELFRIIRSLREQGKGVVHISHRLEELRQISDRVTVMRDGQHVDTVETGSVSIDDIISMMVGRTIFEESPHVPADAAEQPVVLEVRNLSRGRAVQDVSFELRRGEILGVAGLVGAGRTELARLIFGADRKDGGEIEVKGAPVQIANPAQAVELGIAYLSEDRKRHGLALGLDVEANVALASFNNLLKSFGRIDTRRTAEIAEQRVEELDIRTPSIKQKARNLSGGNQQKLVIAKWLTAEMDVLIFDEPTRGIDVGAKQEIYHLLNELAAAGKSILMISSELPENPAHEPPHHRDVRGSPDGRADCGRCRPGKDHDARDATRVGRPSDELTRTQMQSAATRVGSIFKSDAVQRLLALGALVILIIFFAIASPFFATWSNAQGIFLATSVTGILAMGVTFVIITAGIDLSIGTVMTLSAVMTGVFVTNLGLPWGIGIVAGIATGTLMGAINGTLVARFSLPPFIATLGMLNIARGLSLVISELRPIYFPDQPEFNQAFMGSLLGDLGLPDLPNLFFVFLAVAVIAGFILSKTVLGRYIFAIGSNEEATRLSGVRSMRYLASAYVLSGMFAGIAGVVIAARLNSAQPAVGFGYELDAIAAAVIGGTSLAGGEGSIFGTVIGAFIISVLTNGLRLMDVPQEWQTVVTGCIVILAVYLDIIRRRRQG